MADRVVDVVGQEKRRLETEELPPNPKRQRTGTGPHHPQVEDKDKIKLY